MAIVNVGDSQSFSYVGGVQTFTAPVAGVYKLEVIGARGGVCQNHGTNVNGLGGYGRGYIKLKKGEVLYVCVGGKGENGGAGRTTEPPAKGGYNGGGAAGRWREWVDGAGWRYGSGAGGGGATHIALVSGTLSSIGAARIEMVLVVAGGGGGEVLGSSNDYTLGNGGGENGTAGAGGSGGTQSSGYAFGKGQPGASTNDGNQYQGNGGAGGGLYGGYAWQSFDIPYGAGGGSGYIGGVPAFTDEGVTYTPDWITGYSGATGNGSATITLVAKGALPVSVGGNAARIFVNGIEVAKLTVSRLNAVFGKVKEVTSRCLGLTAARSRFLAAIPR